MKFLALAAAAAVLTATPALARTNDAFTGVRAEVTAGYNDITNSPDRNDVTYTGAVGVDVPLGDRFTAGVEATAGNVFEDERTIGGAARLGYAFDYNTLGYVKGGYTNYRDIANRNLDGAVVGVGLQQAISSHSYVTVQYDYSDFAHNTGSHAARAGVGIRF